ETRKLTVATLTAILGLGPDEALALRDKLTTNAKYLILRHGIDRVVSDRVESAIADRTVAGLSLEPVPERVYPQAGGGPHSSLAAHPLGFVNPGRGGPDGGAEGNQ